MIARLIAWSARNLLLVLFGTGAAGIYALVHLPLDAIPDLSDTHPRLRRHDWGQRHVVPKSFGFKGFSGKGSDEAGVRKSRSEAYPGFGC